jgi:hypothetical protein
MGIKTICVCDGCGKELKSTSEKFSNFTVKTNNFTDAAGSRDYNIANLVFCETCATQRLLPSLEKLAEDAETNKSKEEMSKWDYPVIGELPLPDGTFLGVSVFKDSDYPSARILLKGKDGRSDLVASVEYNTVKNEEFDILPNGVKVRLIREDERLRVIAYCAEHDEPVYLEPYNKNLAESPNN